jgi:hypothetical protein
MQMILFSYYPHSGEKDSIIDGLAMSWSFALSCLKLPRHLHTGLQFPETFVFGKFKCNSQLDFLLDQSDPRCIRLPRVYPYGHLEYMLMIPILIRTLNANSAVTE